LVESLEWCIFRQKTHIINQQNYEVHVCFRFWWKEPL